MNKISVIIAVYNTEKYVLKCLESLKNQTYKNIEVLIVNDGSTDHSDLIITEFIDQNPQMDINYLIHKTNRGLAAARLTALEAVTGDYIHMLDSDDYIEPNTYQNAIKRIVELNCNICIWGWIEQTDRDEILFEYKDRYHYFPGVLEGREVCRRKMLRWLWICTGNALYSTSVVRKSLPVFFESLNMGEDFYFICKTLLNSERVCCLPEQNFRCVSRAGSMTHEHFSMQSLQPFELFYRLGKAISVASLLTKDQKKELQDILNAEIRRTYIANVHLACKTYSRSSMSDCISAIKKIRYHHIKLDKTYSKKIIRKKYRAEYWLMHFSLPCYCSIYIVAWKLYQRIIK